MAARKTTKADLDHAMDIHRTIFNEIKDDEPGYAQTTINDVILSLECEDAGVGHYHGGPVSGSAYEFQATLITACANDNGRATAGVFPRSRIKHMIADLKAFKRRTQDKEAAVLQKYLDDNPDHFA